MSAIEIHDAVAAARHRLPYLAADYAETAIAAGKTVEKVKGDIVDLMLKGDPANTRSAARANMVKTIAAQYGAEAAASASATPRRFGVDPKTATIGTPMPPVAKGDGLTMGQRSMLDVIERQHGKDARAKAEARLAARAG